MFKLVRKAKTQAARRVCVLGVGGGGCHAIERVLGGGGAEGTIAVLNTDAESLLASHATTKIQIGRQRNAEGGTGCDPEAGRSAAEHDIEMIRGLLSDCDVLILATCLGGGTGTGASPVVLSAARSAGILTLVVATMPFGFEGSQRKRVAQDGLSVVVGAADFVSVIQNDRLFESAGMGGDITAAFERAGDALAGGICSLWHMITQPMLIGLDIGDFKALAAKGTGACLYGFGVAGGVGRANTAVTSLVDGPVFEAGSALRSCSGAMVCVCGSHDMTLQEVGDVMTPLLAVLPEDCDIQMGTVINEAWKNRLFVSVFLIDRKRTVTPVSRGSKHPEASGRGGRAKPAQEELKLDDGGRGRFNNTAATILDGEDLDTPTFIRRRLVIER